MAFDPAQKGAGATVTVTRPADTAIYTANDVVGPSTSSAGAVLSFPLRFDGAGEFMITSATLKIDSTAIISGETSYNLYLFSSSPASAYGDNAAFDISSADLPILIDKVALGTPVDEGSILYIRSDGLNQQITLDTTGIAYGYLVTVGAYTPVASRIYRIKLHGLPL